MSFYLPYWQGVQTQVWYACPWYVTQTIKTFKFRSFSNSLTFRPLWQKLLDLRYVHNSWSNAVFAKPFAHQRFPTCITDCGLRGRPLCIGFCHCLQVVIGMKYCSAFYRPVWVLKKWGGGLSRCGGCWQLACCNLKVMCCKYNSVRLLWSIAFLSNQLMQLLFLPSHLPSHLICQWQPRLFYPVQWLLMSYNDPVCIGAVPRV